MNAQYRINKHNKKAYHKRIDAVIVSVPPKLLFLSAYILAQ